jgi:3-deoxy-D-manno-octulosonate 8-phosphate phosphatase (KDO 8-P phosphatase)
MGVKILIAHRGNFAGQNAERENTVDYLEEALAAGYDVELDVRAMRNNIFLGHDTAIEKVPSIEWLRDSRKWVHCKDRASYDLLSKYRDIRCFMQEKDDVDSQVGRYRWISSGAAKDCITYGQNMIVHESWVNDRCDHFGIYGDNVSQFKDRVTSLTWSINKILLDVDGVMTNGKKVYNSSGECVHKEFCDKDWTAIKRMRAAGLHIYLVSADSWNKEIADNRGIPFIHGHTTDLGRKIDVLRKQGFNLSECAYIGDDYYDLELMWHVGEAYCPEDAIDEVKAACTIIPAKGGENCIAKFYSMIKCDLRENFPHE